MAVPTKVRSLVVRPRAWASLTFQVAGAIERISATIGSDIDGVRIFDEVRDWRSIYRANRTAEEFCQKLMEESVARLRLNAGISPVRRAMEMTTADAQNAHRQASDQLRDLFLTSHCADG